MLNNISILITGGTGSFGKKFIKTVLEKYPEVERIVIYSRDELKQYEMQQQSPYNNPRIRYFIGDVRDKERLLRAMDGIDYVVHAAALKHVPACEYNPFEAIKTNIHGAQNVIDVAIDRKVIKVVALSTDKACSPINLYGATKLCSDKLFITGNAYVGKYDTTFSVVRYGNVAGSRGSVIPLFKELIKNGAKELPITDKRMTRFWITLEEAVDLVLTAFKKMLGGELYVRKIPSMKIIDLAKAMAPNLMLKEVNIRPGEKIHETMISSDDSRNTLEFDKYYLVKPDFDWWDPNNIIAEGKPVQEGFEYHSGNNSDWLTIKHMRKLIEKL